MNRDFPWGNVDRDSVLSFKTVEQLRAHIVQFQDLREQRGELLGRRRPDTEAQIQLTLKYIEIFKAFIDETKAFSSRLQLNVPLLNEEGLVEEEEDIRHCILFAQNFPLHQTENHQLPMYDAENIDFLLDAVPWYSNSPEGLRYYIGEDEYPSLLGRFTPPTHPVLDCLGDCLDCFSGLMMLGTCCFCCFGCGLCLRERREKNGSH